MSDPQVPDPTIKTPADKVSALMTALSKMAPGLSQMFGGSGGGRPASPLVHPGMIGQVPSLPGPPQVAGAGAPASTMAAPNGMPSRQAAPLGPASQTALPSVNPGNALFQTGFEFGNPKARDAAVVSSAIQGVTSLISQVKERKEAKTKRQAENYMSQIVAFQQAGDQEGLANLLEDPKVVKTLEKGLDYIMPKTPGEPPPPEASGIHAFLNKLTGKENKQQARLPAPNTPGGVSIPRQPQSQANTQALADLVSKAALQAAQSDPELAKRLGIGTGLSGKEATEAERYQSGLATAPADERKMFQAHQDLIEKFNQENRMMIAELASKERISAAGNRSAEEQTRISAGPLYARVKMSKEIADAQIKAREAVAKGKISDANRIMTTTLTSQINNLRTNAEKAKKDDNADMAAEFTKQADELQKRYDEVQKTMQTDVDSIIKNILDE